MFVMALAAAEDGFGLALHLAITRHKTGVGIGRALSSNLEYLFAILDDSSVSSV
jgi:hypothetical protein